MWSMCLISIKCLTAYCGQEKSNSLYCFVSKPIFFPQSGTHCGALKLVNVCMKELLKCSAGVSVLVRFLLAVSAGLDVGSVASCSSVWAVVERMSQDIASVSKLQWKIEKGKYVVYESIVMVHIPIYSHFMWNSVQRVSYLNVFHTVWYIQCIYCHWLSFI